MGDQEADGADRSARSDSDPRGGHVTLNVPRAIGGSTPYPPRPAAQRLRIDSSALAEGLHSAGAEARTSVFFATLALFFEGYAVTKLYVGNLPFSATEDGVRALFSAHGTVEKVTLITDRDTGRPRGFGFVEMSNADASRAMQALNGKDFEGRALKVNEAQERERSGGGGRGGPRRY
jgi:hypothetical protein